MKMRSLSFLVLIIASAVLIGCPFLPADSTFHVGGRVTDSDGQSIEGATVVMECPDHPNPQITGTADYLGCFSFGIVVAPGHYNCRVEIQVDGFKAFSTELPTLTDNLYTYVLEPEGSTVESTSSPMSEEEVILHCPTLIPGWSPTP